MSSYTNFTPHERERAIREVKYGTQTVQLTAESFPEVDDCSLCLTAAIEPVVCSHGHLFCKGCAYEYLLHQKTKQKRLAREAAAETAADAAVDAAASRRAESERLEEFNRAQNALLPSAAIAAASATVASSSGAAAGAEAAASSSSSNSSSAQQQAPPGYKAVATEDGRVAFVLDADVIRKHTTAAGVTRLATAEERNAQSRVVPSFWIPAVAPDAGVKKTEKMDEIICPKGSHPLKLKQLRPVHFTKPTEQQAKDMKIDGKSSRFVCGACSRLLTKSVKSVCLRACGHVICDPCRVRLVDKDPTCPDCAAGVVTSDIVALSTGAAGFASSGAAVASKRVRAAFH